MDAHVIDALHQNQNRPCPELFKKAYDFPPYLGVLLDESLNWTSHVKYLKSKLSFASSMIYKIRNFVPTTALRIIY